MGGVSLEQGGSSHELLACNRIERKSPLAPAMRPELDGLLRGGHGMRNGAAMERPSKVLRGFKPVDGGRNDRGEERRRRNVFLSPGGRAVPGVRRGVRGHG